ncbi:hypothetical protein [Catellatospora sichuanensis]|uniref:hypothetical protein n=1 Tax=Catellatospora sichuanensis TaxID=1969805 RepID=UPI0011829877|nr:hypothetical protein [Catellatospora sichuanensis]
MSVAVAAMALATAGTMAPAVATPTSSKTVQLKWLICPEGTSNTGWIDSSRTYQPEGGTHYRIELGGTIVTCSQPYAPWYVFGLGTYTSTDAIGRAVPFSADAPRTYDFLSSFPIRTDVQAVCLLANETTRLDCLSIGWVTENGSTHPVIEGALPVDSPRVAMPAVTDLTRPGDNPVGPGCGLCL